MTTTRSWTEEFVEVGGTKTQVLKGGSGSPLVFLQGGGPALESWEPIHEALSQRFTVYVPSHPGFNGTERPSWVSTINDVAHFYLGFMQTLDLERVSLVGHSMGGWVAAEIAAMGSPRLRGVVLVDAAGVKPQAGQIAETLMVSPDTVKEIAYHDISKAPPEPELSQDEQGISWRNREMTSRLCWTPYLHNPQLTGYLRFVRVPTLVVWGRQDSIIPLECGEIYLRSIPGSTMHVIDQCGHLPTMEKTQELADVATNFLSRL
jgi:pimeloyl-ACP methyl ester carboxylesterase